MHIQSLQISGIKALDRTIELTPLTLIAGPNGSGKTAILEAIRFVLLGYCPGMNKTNAALFDLSSGNRMQATLTMSDGDIYTRGLSLSGSSVKADQSGPGLEGIQTPCLDPELYFGLSEKDRVQYIFERCKAGGDLTPEAILARVMNGIEAPEPATEEFIKAKKGVEGQVWLDLASKGGIQEKLELAASTLRDSFKEANAAAKDSEGAVRTLTELRLSSAQVFATVPELEKQQKEQQAKIEELQKRNGALAAQYEAAERADRQRRTLEQALAVPVIDDKTIQDAEKDAETLIVKCQEALAAKETAEKALGKMPDVIPVRDTHSKAHTAFTIATNARQTAESGVRCVKNEIAALEAQECCPHCKSKGKTWKKNLEDTLTERLKNEETALKLAEEAETKAEVAEIKAAKALKAAEEELAAYTKAFAEHQHHAGNYANAKNAAERQVQAVATLREKIAAQQQAREQYQKQLAELATVERPSAEEVSRINGEIAVLRAKLADIALKLDTAQRTRHDLQRAEQAAQKHREHAARRDVLKQAGTAVVKLKSDLVAEAFKALLERANSVTGDLLKTPLAYHPERNELGRWEGHVFVTHRTFSGTEKALAYIGLSVALAWDAPFRIVLLDEASRMTGAKMELVQERLAELVEADVVHQVICVVPWENPADVAFLEGWHLVSTAAEAPVMSDAKAADLILRATV